MEARKTTVKVDYHVGDSPEEVFSLLEGWGEGEITEVKVAYLMELLFFSLVVIFFGILLSWFYFPVAAGIGIVGIVVCIVIYVSRVKVVVLSAVSPVRGERELEFRDDKLCIRKGESVDWWTWKCVVVQEVGSNVLIVHVGEDEFILFRGKSISEGEFDRVKDFLEKRGLLGQRNCGEIEEMKRIMDRGVLYRSVLLHFVGVLVLYLLVYDYWKHGG